jgi:hypothetical protein
VSRLTSFSDFGHTVRTGEVDLKLNNCLNQGDQWSARSLDGMIMRRRGRRYLALMVLTTCICLGSPAAQSESTLPECHIHQSRPVSFRDAQAADVLEISIGTGPCAKATLTIVVRAEDSGQVLYAYVAPFKRHVITESIDPALPQEATWFVSGQLSSAMGTTADLPPFLEPEAYEEQHSAAITISKEEYEALRLAPKPMLSHPTYYEGWRNVVLDETTGAAKIVVEGAV